MNDYIRGSSVPEATGYTLHQKINGEYTAVGKQTFSDLSFVNLGELDARGKPLEVAVTFSSVDLPFSVAPLTEFLKNGEKRHYVRLTGQCDIESSEGSSSHPLSATMYVDNSSSFNLSSLSVSYNNGYIYITTNFGNAPALEMTLTDDATIYVAGEWTVYHADSTKHYTDFIPVKLLENDTDGFCVRDFSDDDTYFSVIYGYADTSFDSYVTAATGNELGGGYKFSTSNLEKVTKKPGVNYVIFHSTNSSTDCVHVTNSVCFSIPDVTTVELYSKGGYMDQGSRVQTSKWYHSNPILIENLVDGPDGWCVYGESSDYGSSGKLELWSDSNGYWLETGSYEDFSGPITVEEILEFKQQYPSATHIVFNLYVDNAETGKDVIYISGKCLEEDRRFAVRSFGNNDLVSDYSSEVEYTGSTHLYKEQIVSASTCQSKGRVDQVCSRCGTSHSQETSKLDHIWGTTTYTWDGNGEAAGGDNLYRCFAERICSGNGTSSHSETAEATISYNVTVEPTTSSSGTQIMTATFSEDWAETQTREVTMRTRCLSPTNTGVGKVGDSTYRIYAYNPNDRESGAELFLVLQDATGVVLHALQTTIHPNSSLEKEITLESSGVASIYTMYFRMYPHSDSLPVTGYVS